MSQLQNFNDKPVRTAWSEEQNKWYFSIVDVIAVLSESIDPNAYWRKLKQRLKEKGNETVTNCHGLKISPQNNTVTVRKIVLQYFNVLPHRGGIKGGDKI
jgi:hypothetical protein